MREMRETMSTIPQKPSSGGHRSGMKGDTSGLSAMDRPASKDNESGVGLHSGTFMISRYEETSDDEESILAGSATAAPSNPKVTFDLSGCKQSPASCEYAASTSKTGSSDTQKDNSGQGTSRGGEFDHSLARLFKAMNIAYHSGSVASPKFRSFKGLKFTLKDKLRLNNIIWREWHKQYIKQEIPKVVSFNVSIGDTHKIPAAIVLEGKYWKRRLSNVSSEYMKWRVFFKNNLRVRSMEQSNLTDLLNRVAEQDAFRLIQTPSYTDMVASGRPPNSDVMDFTDTLFSGLPYPSGSFNFPLPRDVVSLGREYTQPGLTGLQPTLDDFMDTMDPFQGGGLVHMDTDILQGSDILSNIDLFLPPQEVLDPIAEEQRGLGGHLPVSTGAGPTLGTGVLVDSALLLGPSHNPPLVGSGMQQQQQQQSSLGPHQTCFQQQQQQHLETPSLSSLDLLGNQPNSLQSPPLLAMPVDSLQSPLSTHSSVSPMSSGPPHPSPTAHSHLLPGTGGITALQPQQQQPQQQPQQHLQQQQQQRQQQQLRQQHHQVSYYCHPKDYQGGGAAPPPLTTPSLGTPTGHTQLETQQLQSDPSLVQMGMSQRVSPGIPSMTTLGISQLSGQVIGGPQPQVIANGPSSMASSGNVSSASGQQRVSGLDLPHVTAAVMPSVTTNGTAAPSVGGAMGQTVLQIVSAPVKVQADPVTKPKQEFVKPTSVPRRPRTIVPRTPATSAPSTLYSPLQACPTMETAAAPGNHTSSVASARSPAKKSSSGPTSFLAQLLTKGKITLPTPALVPPGNEVVGGGVKVRHSSSPASVSSGPPVSSSVALAPIAPQQQQQQQQQQVASNMLSLSSVGDMPVVTTATCGQSLRIAPVTCGGAVMPAPSASHLSNAGGASGTGGAEAAVPFPDMSLFAQLDDLSTAFSASNSPSEDAKSPGTDSLPKGGMSAEHVRRGKIKGGLDLLDSIIPSLSQNPSSKISKAAKLSKTAEHVRKIKAERLQMEEEAILLKKEIAALNSSINTSQSQLPATGAPITRQRAHQMERRLRDYVRTRTLENWKFYVFSEITHPLFTSFHNTVSTANMDDFYRTMLAWVDQHCTLPSLRTSVTQSLCKLCTSTSLLSDQSRVPQEAQELVLNDQDSP